MGSAQGHGEGDLAVAVGGREPAFVPEAESHVEANRHLVVDMRLRAHDGRPAGACVGDGLAYQGLPDAPARYKLLEIHLSEKPLADDVDLGALCDRLEGHSGADIRNICQQAAQAAFMDALAEGNERPIAQQDLLAIIEEQKPSVRPADLVRFRKFEETGK